METVPIPHVFTIFQLPDRHLYHDVIPNKIVFAIQEFKWLIIQNS
jgi:hypothetical protein